MYVNYDVVGGVLHSTKCFWKRRWKLEGQKVVFFVSSSSIFIEPKNIFMVF